MRDNYIYDQLVFFMELLPSTAYLMQSCSAEWGVLPWAWSRPVPWWLQRRSQIGCLLAPSSQTPWLSPLAEKHTDCCYKSNVCQCNHGTYSKQTSWSAQLSLSICTHAKSCDSRRILAGRIFDYAIAIISTRWQCGATMYRQRRAQNRDPHP